MTSGLVGVRVLTLTIATLSFVLGIACTNPTPVGRRVIVLGFDGLDYDVTRTMIAWL